MKKIASLLLVATCSLAACNDGVPKVTDPHDVVVDGQKITQSEFLQKYCIGKVVSETCDRVKNAMSKDATKGALPNGW